MKKFLCAIPLIIFFWFSPAFICHASYLPPVDPITSQIPSFLETVAQTQIAQDTGVYSPYKPDINSVNQLINGRSIDASRNEVYVDNDGLITTTFYDFNGKAIPATDTFTCFGTSDVGQYTYVCSKETGEILGIVGRNDSVCSTLQAGDLRGFFPEIVITSLGMQQGTNTSLQVLSAYQDAKLRESLAVYNENDLSTFDKAFIDSYDYHLYMHSNYYGWTCYVSNTCSNDCVVSGVNGVYSYSGNYYTAPNIYANNLSSVTFANGNEDNRGFLKPYGPWNYYGYNFTYTSAWTNSSNPLFDGGYLDFKAPTQAEYNSYKNLSNKFKLVRPVTVQGDTTQNYYNYTYVTENPPQYVTNINNNYDPSEPQSLTNYPLVTNVTLPNYQTENNYLTNIYNYYTTPSTGDTIGQLDPNDLTDNIPILNNLKYRFPFSIPFDIYDLVQGLAVEREAPSFYWTINFPVINYDWVIDFDLSAWDTQASIFRTCFLILFIIALAMWAYNHFFGN